MTPQITKGMRVWFTKDDATLTGTVFHTTVDIQNSRKMAVIEVDNELPGIVETVPLDQITNAMNIVYLSGSLDFLKTESNDRRFFPINAIA